MATVKGVNRTVLDAVTVDHTLRPGLSSGIVRVMSDTYEAAALAQLSVIEMGGEIPKGATVLFHLLMHDPLGGSVTLDVGDEEDPNRYINAKDCSAAGSQYSIITDGVEYQVDMTTASTPDNQVLITVGGSGTVTGTIKLFTFYVND